MDGHGFWAEAEIAGRRRHSGQLLAAVWNRNAAQITPITTPDNTCGMKMAPRKAALPFVAAG